MWKALAFKEIRDVLPIVCIALIAYLACIACLMGYPVFFGAFSDETWGTPFLDYQIKAFISIISIGFTIALGFWQTVAENTRGTWLFLLHRPASQRTIIGVKLAVGASVYLVVSAIPILVYALWAATPGTHPSPFAWWMTEAMWYGWLFPVMVYFGAFLSGVRPARWYGSRLMPLLAVALLATLLGQIPYRYWSWGIAAILIVSLIDIYVILYSCKTRDFS
jgi:ABC-type transport system involved in multi-copper enzyme maturation permease subunit